ncbi:E3 ubiquitin-protein ligase NEURL3 [Sceloporus undulatus]|uniref:E3 ubiquitin-protein ligase NEURL3 n=1 Tax=Sceloporus undulatus TaxID=8520 RepID=UPI001C4C69DF|nr:E3 ubiquitin-protein ligase NEURL3 [Sceloporus undulatus]
MGACLSPADDSDVSGRRTSAPLFFHPYVKGSQIVMDESHSIASRVATFCNGLVFSNRPVEPYEKVTLKISKEDGKWHGGLRVGFTWEDPSLWEPRELPPFACPNLVNQGKTRACVLPDEYCEEGTIVSYWVDNQGCVFCSINGEPEDILLLDGVLVTSPLWAVMDIYGRTKEVQLLDPSNLPTNNNVHSPLLLAHDDQIESNRHDSHSLLEGPTGDECAVCFGHKANTMMLPCSHANFCACCSLKILKTSGCCPLCRTKVKKILHVSGSAEREGMEDQSDNAKDIQPLR